MKAQNVSREDLCGALARTNETHGYSLRWNREPEPLNAKQTAWQFTLRSDKSKIRGARTSWNGRNTVAASWHAHGHFFEALLAINPKAVIRTALHGPSKITAESGNWEDRNIGSQVCPVAFSDTSIL